MALEESINKILDLIDEDPLPFLILAHYDSDGLISSSIIAKILYDKKLPFVLRIVDELNVEEIKESSFNKVILLDLQVKEELNRLGEEKRIISIDHHPLKVDHSKILCFNPYLFGYDGNSDACASTLAYLIAKEYDDSLIDLAPLVLVASLEDRQDIAENRNFKGINKNILEESEEAGLIDKGLGIISYLNFDESFLKSFSLLFEPFIHDIFDDLKKCEEFLKECGLKNEMINKKFSEMETEEHAMIAKAIASKLLKKGYSPSSIERIYGYNFRVYNLGKYTNLRYISKSINYISRSMNYDKFLKYFLKENISKLNFESYFNEYISLIKNFLISIIKEKKIKEYKNFIYAAFPKRLEKFVGDFAYLISSSNIEKEYFVFASDHDEIFVKISIRSRSQSKVDLGEISSSLAKNLEGSGGGHRNASGALIPKKNFDAFLKDLDLKLS